MTLTMLFRAPRMEPRTSGYSSPRYSYNTTPVGNGAAGQARQAQAHSAAQAGDHLDGPAAALKASGLVFQPFSVQHR
eukprot:1155956-Pelagomonas_calceolata.AAC.16